MSSVKRLALAIVQFLAEQKQYGNLSPDAQESLEVAVQCLETAFELSREDVATLSVSKSLLDIFHDAVASEIGNLPAEASAEAKSQSLEQVLTLKSEIEEIQYVQRRGEINHDIQSSNHNDNENSNDKDSDVESSEESTKRLSKLGADMELGLAALSNDLKQLNAKLVLEVDMVNKMTQDQEGPYSVVKAHYDAIVSELDSQIATLQNERDEFAHLFAQASSNVNACKISEQLHKEHTKERDRCRTLQEQRKLADLRKKKTPLAKFSRNTLKSITATSDEDEERFNDPDPDWTRKSLRKPPHCICRKGGCHSCSCVKSKRACIRECGCRGEVCQNTASEPEHVLKQEDLRK